MDCNELKSARKQLGLSIAECAEHIGKVDAQTWELWENGERPINPSVVSFVETLLNRRREIIKQVAEMGENAKKIAVVYYETPEYCQSVIEWRFTQSLCATLSREHKVKLVTFDFDKYSKFLKDNALEDNQQNRSAWAAFSVGKQPTP